MYYVKISNHYADTIWKPYPYPMTLDDFAPNAATCTYLHFCAWTHSLETPKDIKLPPPLPNQNHYQKPVSQNRRERTLKEDRVAVIALHRCGYAPIKFFDILKNLNITKRFVYRTIKRYNEDSSVDDRSRSGRPRSVRTPAVIKAAKERNQRNPKRKQKLLALQMGLSRTTVKRVLNEDLGLRAYRRKTGHRLNARLMDLRLKRCRAFLKRYAGRKYRVILFSDEKIFTVKKSYNKQNDKVSAHSSEEASNRIPRVQRGHFPSSLMVWLGVSYWGLTEISEVLETLGLTGSENTRCGHLSGGQKKRLSIAVELIDNPPVVFLDEPTTGLDSSTSVQCIEMLKKLARGGRTIVCTIHQPTASVYSMFDQVYILAEGLCIYHGSSANTVPYLASIGLQCPKYHNPADYILEIANGEYGKFNDVLAERCTMQGKEQKSLPQPLVSADKEEMSCGKISIVIKPPHELYKFGVLFRRCIIQQYRDWTVTHLKVLLHIAIGIMLGLLFEKAGNDGSKTISNLGYLIVSIAYLCYTSLMPAVLRFPSELLVLKKENFNNWYNLKTYYAAVLVTGIPLQIWYSFVYSAPSYFLSGQPLEISRFFMFVMVLANVTLIADAIGNVIGTCVNPINGTFLGAITTCAMIAFAGFLVLFAHMSPGMRTISHVSFMRYAFEAIVLSVYSDGRQPLPCPETKLYCHSRYPSELLKQFSFSSENYWPNIGVLLTEIVIIRIIAYFTLSRTVRTSN
ncbi:hypothetical protein evm_002751 [Chilo suppressalis]|nr:hypothetical protein evm_002751 [Chilo suppressalis]